MPLPAIRTDDGDQFIIPDTAGIRLGHGVKFGAFITDFQSFHEPSVIGRATHVAGLGIYTPTSGV